MTEVELVKGVRALLLISRVELCGEINESPINVG